MIDELELYNVGMHENFFLKFWKISYNYSKETEIMQITKTKKNL